jgi:hypothetical protein
MQLLLRQSCVFMLLLLQVFAPLVHAHTDASSDDGSIYIHTFGTQLAIDNSGSSIEHLQSVQHTDVIITLNSVIKEKNNLTDLLPKLYVQQHLWRYLQLQQSEQKIVFPAFFNTSKTSVKFFVTAPRAPPQIKS